MELRRKFLEERAERMAQKMRTTEEKALKAILKAEDSKRIYASIQNLTGKSNSLLTQVDVLSTPSDPTSTKITLTSKDEIEEALIKRNQCHSKQSLATPFAANPLLAQAVNPNGNHSIDSILDGTFLESTDEPIPLTETENTWVQALQRLVYSPIKLLLSPEDFKQFFNRKQESTSSSPSGRHMGHYKVMLDELHLGRPLLAEIITAVAQIFLHYIVTPSTVAQSVLDHAREGERPIH